MKTTTTTPAKLNVSAIIRKMPASLANPLIVQRLAKRGITVTADYVSRIRSKARTVSPVNAVKTPRGVSPRVGRTGATTTVKSVDLTDNEHALLLIGRIGPEKVIALANRALRV